MERRLIRVALRRARGNRSRAAELLGISVGTVRSRLRLAREAFSREVKRLALAQGGGRKEAV